MKYLKKINEVGIVLDHRLTPEVSAMLAAMSSRLPAGGIEARYREVVEAVAKDLYERRKEAHRDVDRDEPIWLWKAEEQLTEYPLHPVVQGFFDKFIKQYGHASIQECVGQPAVYVEGVSPFTAYLSFDNPLVAGQEFSTRAVRRRDWPMCREAMVVDVGTTSILQSEDERILKEVAASQGRDIDLMDFKSPSVLSPHPELKALHESWLEVFEAEVEAWKVELQESCAACRGRGFVPHRPTHETCTPCMGTGKKYPWIKDPQAFRPALDRARWAIPGTISTGFCHTANTRVMGRVIQAGMDFSATTCEHCAGRVAVPEDNLVCSVCGGKGTAGSKVWTQIKEAYEAALPGMKGMWLKEAVVGEERQLPGHLKIGFVSPGKEVRVNAWPNTPYELSLPEESARMAEAYQRSPSGYLDPVWNQLAQVHIEFQCSWAVARDWHRHRTAYPWHLNIVRGLQRTEMDVFRIHNAYKPLSDKGKDINPGPPWYDSAPAHSLKLLERSAKAFTKFRKNGDMEKAMLCLPFGTLVSMRTTMGLRDAVYMLELRHWAPGSNHEYRAQAGEALRQLEAQLGPELAELLLIKGPNKDTAT